MPAETPNILLRQVLTALDQGDWTIFDTHPGLYETRQHLPHMRATFPDLHHTIEVELVEGEMIACVAIVHGTHRGPLMGITQSVKR
jgi:predicted ester cyclase